MSAPTLFHEVPGVRVRTLRNVLDASTREEWEGEPGMPIIDYAPAWVREAKGLRVIANGIQLDYEEAQTVTAKAGDGLTFYVAPHEITLGMVLIGILISAAMGGLNYAISALTAPSVSPLAETLEESPTYGFDGLSNTVRPGTTIPIVYGTHRVGGHIISQFTRPKRGESASDSDPLVGELNTLLALCTGPIESITDVRVNKNPISDFRGAGSVPRLGGMYQEAIPGFDDIVVTSTKDAALEYADAESKRLEFTTVGDCDAFQVVYRFAGGLYKVAERGQIRSNTVEIQLEYRPAGVATAEWANVGIHSFSQRTQSAFDAWSPRVQVPRGQYEIRVTRKTPDENTATGYSASTVLYVQEITEEKLTYPEMALLAVHQLPTNQVSGAAPEYDCLVKGRRVRVYTTLTDYTVQWSDNPAWCLLDLLTDSKWALGVYVGRYRIDYQAFLDWAAYCDELVPIDARGGMEKRFRLNIVLDGSLKAPDAINQICMTGRASFVLKGDQWSVCIDRPAAPVQLFQMSRIRKDSFSVTKRAKSELSNYIVGEFWNEDLDYEQDTIPLEDPTLIDGNPQVEKTISLLGTTSTSQAMRHLAYYMLSNRLCRRTVEHEVSIEALNLEAGDVYLVAHDVPGWGFSGRVRSVDATGTSLRIDRTVTIEAGKTYELTAIHPGTDEIDVVRVTNAPGETDLITVTGGWSDTPGPGLDYSLGEVGASTVAYRCLSISRGTDPMKRKVVGREYNPAIYEQDLTVLPLPSTTRLPDPRRIPDPVTDLRLAERTVYAEDGTMSIAIDVHFTLPVVAGVQAMGFWRRAGTSWWEQAGPPVSAGYLSITRDVESPGVSYEISVVSVSATGNRKHPDQGTRGTITTTGTTRRPGKVSGFTVDRTVAGLVFRWYPLDPVTNFDLAYYELRDGASWDTATVIARTADIQVETGIAVKGVRTFLVKGVNTAGKDSYEPAVVVMTVDARIGENVIYTRTEDPSWAGSSESMVVVGDNLVLDTVADDAGRAAAQQVLAPFSSGYAAGGRGAGFRVTGSYTTAIFEVAATPLRCLVATDLEVDQIDTTLTWDSEQLADKTWDSDFARSRSWAVAPDGRVEVILEMRFSTTSANDGDFGPWQVRPQNIEVLTRWAQARVRIVIKDPAYTARLKKFRILFDVPDVVEGGLVSTSAVGTTDVTFAKAFNAEPRLAATVIGATAGDEIFVTAKTVAGFTIAVRNAGSLVARTVNYTAVGY